MVIERKTSTTPKPKPILPKTLQKRQGSIAPVPPTPDVTVSQSSLKGQGVTNTWGTFTFNKLRAVDERTDDVKLKFTEFDPLELARQLTLVEFDLFTAIRVSLLCKPLLLAAYGIYGSGVDEGRQGNSCAKHLHHDQMVQPRMRLNVRF